MPSRSSTRRRRRELKPDENQAAFATVKHMIAMSGEEDGRNPAAVALGRLGGLKGGKARAKALSAEDRTEIARLAANARWKRTKKV